MRLATVLVLGVVAGLVSVALLLALDARRMLLDTDAWTDATAVVLEDDDSRAALVHVVMDGTVARLTCDSTIARIAVRTSLGQRALGRVAVEVDELLASDRARSLWRDANRAGHEAFVRAARTDRAVGDDRLLELGATLDRAASVTDVAEFVLRRDAPDPEPADEECDGATERLQVVDADTLRAAGDLARTLHDARWLPRALGGAIAGCLLVIALVAGSYRRLGLAIAAGGLAALAGAFAVREELTRDPGRLTDGIATQQGRELGDAIVVAVLEPTAEHLDRFAVGAGIVTVVGLILVVVGIVRRRTTTDA